MKITTALSGFLSLSLLATGVFLWSGSRTLEGMAEKINPNGDERADAVALNEVAPASGAHLIPAGEHYVAVNPFLSDAQKQARQADLTSHFGALFPYQTGTQTEYGSQESNQNGTSPAQTAKLTDLSLNNPLIGAALEQAGLPTALIGAPATSAVEQPANTTPEAQASIPFITDDQIKIGTDGVKISIPGIGSYEANQRTGVTLSAPGISATIGRSGLTVRETGDSLGNPIPMPATPPSITPKL